MPRQPWLTLYGPLRLGNDPDEDNLTLSAVGTWLRLDCPMDEHGWPGTASLLSAPPDKGQGPYQDPARPWPMPSRMSAVVPPDIIFFTDDGGRTCDLLQSALGLVNQRPTQQAWQDMPTRVRCIDESTHPHHARLDMACMIRRAADLARSPVMSLTNSDIALGGDFVGAMQRLFFSTAEPAAEGDGHRSSSPPRIADNMLVVGRRTDLNLATPRVDFSNPGWASALRDLAAEHGVLHGEYGIDYLVTGRPGIWATQDGSGDDELPHHEQGDGPTARALQSIYDGTPSIHMPPFVVGVYRWDSFVLAQAILSPSIVVVDATAAVTAVHLQRVIAGEPPQHRHRRGASYNDRLVYGLIGTRYLLGHTLNADYELMAGGELVPRIDEHVKQ